jgi:sec-independent protein translocase protein TatB
MFDISWTEFLLIGVVALVVIGPKELPGVLRTLGQWTRKVRSMAADFQNQFHEAMREAEMGDLKKQVDDLAQDFTHLDPLKSVRDDFESMGKDFEKSLDGAPGQKTAEPKADAAAIGEPAATEALSAPVEPPAALSEVSPPPAIEPAAAAEPVRTERTG